MVDMDTKSYIKTCKNTKTTIHFWDLYGGHTIEINHDLQKQLFQNAVERACGEVTSLGRIISEDRHAISKCLKLKRRPSLSMLIKLSKYTDFPLFEVEKNIINIGKSYFHPKLPFKLHNTEGAEIRAAFLSDGHLPRHPTISPVYCAFEEELHLRLIDLYKRIFGDSNIEPRKGHKSLQTRFPAPIGTALELSGVPRGDKRIDNPTVPKDILLGSKNIQSSYLRRVFDDEGDVCFDKYGKRAVRITRATNSDKNEIPRLLLGEYFLLKQFGIDARLYNEGSHISKTNSITSKWRIQIGQQDSLRIFFDVIGFNLLAKNKKLDIALKSYKVKEFPNNFGESFCVNAIKPIALNKGYFEFGDLGKKLHETGRTHDLAGHYISILQKKGVIKKISRGKYVFK